MDRRIAVLLSRMSTRFSESRCMSFVSVVSVIAEQRAAALAETWRHGFISLGDEYSSFD